MFFDRFCRGRSKQPFSSKMNGGPISCKVSLCREIDQEEYCSHNGPSASFMDLT